MFMTIAKHRLPVVGWHRPLSITIEGEYPRSAINLRGYLALIYLHFNHSCACFVRTLCLQVIESSAFNSHEHMDLTKLRVCHVLDNVPFVLLVFSQ